MRTIIIVGAARSGTKVLRDTLADAQGVMAVPYDINYIWRLGNERYPDDALPRDAVDKAKAVKIRSFLKRAARGEEVLVEKTVATGLRIPFVRAVVPDAEFVFLVRDPVDVVESALRQWRARPDWRYSFQKARHFPWTSAPAYALRQVRHTLRRAVLPIDSITPWGPVYPGMSEDLAAEVPLIQVCAEQWRACNEFAIEGFLDEGIVPYTITYESLSASPTGQMKALANALRLPAPTQEGLGIITPHMVGRGTNGLSTNDIRTVEDLCRPTLDRLQELGWGKHACS